MSVAFHMLHEGNGYAFRGMPVPSMMERDHNRATITAWVDGIRRRFGVEIPDIAKKSKVSPSTIYRWYDEKHPFSASHTSLRKIALAFGAPMPGTDPGRAPGFEEGDAEPIAGKLDDLAANDNQGVWRLNSRALELAGYLPGDMLLVDMTVPPRNGDVVCAQVYNLERGTAETKLRIYEAPFLTTRTMDPAATERPLFVDNERVHIAGTVVRSLRVRS